MSDSIEIWKPVAGFEGCYVVSDRGRVMSLGRKVRTKWGMRLLRERVLKPIVCDNGYPQVGLHRDGRSAMIKIHRLVLAAFCGESDLHCNHKNGIRNDNRLSNLEWCTPSENNLHKCRVLGKGRGESNNKAKLTKKQVIEIRDRFGRGGITQDEIAGDYKITPSNVSCIVNRKSWGHIADVI